MSFWNIWVPPPNNPPVPSHRSPKIVERAHMLEQERFKASILQHLQESIDNYEKQWKSIRMQQIFVIQMLIIHKDMSPKGRKDLWALREWDILSRKTFLDEKMTQLVEGFKKKISIWILNDGTVDLRKYVGQCKKEIERLKSDILEWANSQKKTVDNQISRIVGAYNYTKENNQKLVLEDIWLTQIESWIVIPTRPNYQVQENPVTEKLEQIQWRLQTLLELSQITDTHKWEARKMQDRLWEYRTDERHSGLLVTIRQDIESILSRDVEWVKPSMPVDSWAKIIPDIEQDISPANKDFLEYITQIRNQITYKLSSQKRGKSTGDGNFIKHVLKPFLRLVTMHISNNSFDAKSFSWTQVIKLIGKNNDWIENRVRLDAFLRMLEKESNDWDWKYNWSQLLDCIDSFSQNSSFFATQNWVSPLSNLLQELRDRSRLPGE